MMLYFILLKVCRANQGCDFMSFKDLNKSSNWVTDELDGFIWTNTSNESISVNYSKGKMKLIGKLVANTTISLLIDNKFNKYINKSHNSETIIELEAPKSPCLITFQLITGKMVVRGVNFSSINMNLKESEISEGRFRVEYYSMETQLSWVEEKQNQGAYTNVNNAEKSYSFYGTKVEVYGYISTGHGIAHFYIDGEKKGERNTEGPRALNSLLWTSDDLPLGDHTVRVVRVTLALGLNYIIYYGWPKYETVIQHNYLDSSGSWNDQNDIQGTWTNGANAYKSLTFVGTDIFVYGYRSPDHGIMDVYLDNNLVFSDDTNSEIRYVNVLLYSCVDLEYGPHTIRTQRKTGALGINRFIFKHNKQFGMFGAEQIYGYAGQSIWVVVKRTYGTKRTQNFKLKTIDGTAFKGTNYVEQELTMNFAENEMERLVEIKTNSIDSTNANYTFTCRLEDTLGKAYYGPVKPVTVNLMNVDLNFPWKRVNFASMTSTGTWTTDENGGVTSQVGASLTFTYTGSKLSVYGRLNTNYGLVKISIDGSSFNTEMNTKGGVTDNYMIFMHPNLAQGQHTVRIECLSDTIGINYIEYYDESDPGKFTFIDETYEVHKDGSVVVEIQRVDGYYGEARVTLKTVSGTAVSGVHFKPIDEQVVFKNQEIVRRIRIFTIKDPKEESLDLTFNVVLENPTGASLGAITTKPIRFYYIHYPVEQVTTVSYQSLTKSQGWTYEAKYNGGFSETAGRYIETTFTGIKVYIYGYISEIHGDCAIFIDDMAAPVASVNTSGPRTLEVLLYVSPILEYGEHKVRLTLLNKAVGVNFFKYYDSWEYGVFDIVEKNYTIIQNSTCLIEIHRAYGSVGVVEVSIECVEDTATVTNNFLDFNQEIKFNEGETSKEFRIFGVNQKFNEDQAFTLKARITGISNYGRIGSVRETTITILYPYYPDDKYQYIAYGEMAKTQGWADEPQNEGGYSNSVGATRSITFNGVKASIYGYIAWYHGIIEFSVDGEILYRLETNDTYRQLKTLLFVTPDLKYGTHTVQCKRITGAIGINFANYLTGFKETNMFTRTVDFTLTNDFSGSYHFEKSTQFSKSQYYSKSPYFSSSNGFTMTYRFSETQKLSNSNKFSISRQFTRSSDFSVSEVFRSTNKFSKTDLFKQTSQFMETKVFSDTDVFIGTNNFPMSSEFSESAIFMDSKKFSMSNIFKKTNNFEKSYDFTFSSQFSENLETETKMPINIGSSSIDENTQSSIQDNVDKDSSELVVDELTSTYLIIEQAPSSLISEKVEQELTSLLNDKNQESSEVINEERTSTKQVFTRELESEEIKDIDSSAKEYQVKQTSDIISLAHSENYQVTVAVSQTKEHYKEETSELNSQAGDINVDNISALISQTKQDEVKYTSKIISQTDINSDKQTSLKNTKELTSLLNGPTVYTSSIKETIDNAKPSILNSNIEIIPISHDRTDIDATSGIYKEYHTTFQTLTITKTFLDNDSGITTNENEYISIKLPSKQTSIYASTNAFISSIRINNSLYSSEKSQHVITTEIYDVTNDLMTRTHNNPSSYQKSKQITHKSLRETNFGETQASSQLEHKENQSSLKIQFEDSSNIYISSSVILVNPYDDQVDTSGNNKAGMIVGIVIGVIAVIVIILVVIFFIMKKRTNDYSASSSSFNFPNEEMETETGVDGTTFGSLPSLDNDEGANIDDIFTSEYYESISNELLN